MKRQTKLSIIKYSETVFNIFLFVLLCYGAYSCHEYNQEQERLQDIEDRIDEDITIERMWRREEKEKKEREEKERLLKAVEELNKKLEDK